LAVEPQDAARFESLFEKLKPGPGRASKDVFASQRRRLHAATVELVIERGYSKVTVRELARTAGVSTRTFYNHFANFDDCFTSTYRSIVRATLEQIARTAADARDPEQALRSSLHGLLAEVARNPHPARLVLVDSFDAGPALLREMERAAHAVESQLLTRIAGSDLPTPICQAVIAGIERVIRIRVLEGRESELLRVATELCDWALALLELSPETTSATADAAPAQRGQHGTVPERPDFSSAAFGSPGSERARILSAATKLALRSGYPNLTVPAIRREAGSSRRAFDDLFDGVEGCFLAAVEALALNVLRRARRRGEGAPDPETATDRIADALCVELAADPALARLCLFEILEPGAAGVRRREALVTTAAAELEGLYGASDLVSALATEASVAGSWQLLQAEVMAGNATCLTRLAPLVARVLVVPREARLLTYG
jgi:AcrR family transcriptional regulator